MADEQPAPDRNDEYLFYQTLLGAWPPTDIENGSAGGRVDGARCCRRAPQPMRSSVTACSRTCRRQPAKPKRTRAGSIPTPITNARSSYSCARAGPRQEWPLPAGPGADRARVAFFGRFNALSQILLKMTSPGVPDIYQGQELWDYSLVDPDNRLPVDFVRRRALLAELKARVKTDARRTPARAVPGPHGRQPGWPHQALHHVAHAELPPGPLQLFARGSYTPLEAQGAEADHLVAFARRAGAEKIVVVVPRLVLGLIDDIGQPPVGQSIWGTTWLALPGEKPGTTYYQLFTGETLPLGAREGQAGLALAEALGHFPVALLVRETDGPVPEG